MTDFQTKGYQVVRGAINRETAKILAMQFQMLRDNVCHIENIDPNQTIFNNDPQVTNSFAWYSPVGFEALLQYIRPKMQEITGKRLYPCYSYARIYYNGATMATHVDRPSCQYSCTMTIEVDKNPWEIWITGLDGKDASVDLDIGDMLVYRGDKLAHWRNEYKENYQIQVFMHFVDVEGEFANQKYDARPMLGLPLSYRDESRSLK